MNKLTTISIALIVVLAVSLVAGLYFGTNTFGNNPPPSPSPTFSPTPSPTLSPSPSPTPVPTTRTVIDYLGRTVTIPFDVERVAVPAYHFDLVIAMLGGRDKIVSTSINYNSNPLLAKVFPESISTPFDGAWTVNMEQLLIDNPQVVFIVDRSALNLSDVPIFEPISQANMTCVKYYAGDIAGWEQTVELVGVTLGGDAVNIASDYVSYVEGQVTTVSNAISSIPASQYPKVLMINPTNMQIQGANTTQDAFITRAGGINAASDIGGYENDASMEEIIAMNPDVIILLGTTEDKNQIMSDSQWASLSAVQNGKVYVNPVGCSAWHSLAPECALETTWIAKTLYPSQFESVDMVQEIQTFYQTYFGVTLTASEAEGILTP